MSLTVIKLASILGAISLLLTNCSRYKESVHKVLSPPYYPKNFKQNKTISNSINRVLVLPVSYHEEGHDFLDRLDIAVFEFFKRMGVAETIRVSRSYMSNKFGFESIPHYQLLPHHFLSLLQDEYQGDAILFTHVSAYDPYKPIAIDLNAKLVSIDGTENIWAFDESFDSGHLSVKMGAIRHQEKYGGQNYPIYNGDSVLQSPHRFAKYAIFTMFKTLPKKL